MVPPECLKGCSIPSQLMKSGFLVLLDLAWDVTESQCFCHRLPLSDFLAYVASTAVQVPIFAQLQRERGGRVQPNQPARPQEQVFGQSDDILDYTCRLSRELCRIS